MSILHSLGRRWDLDWVGWISEAQGLLPTALVVPEVPPEDRVESRWAPVKCLLPFTPS